MNKIKMEKRKKLIESKKVRPVDKEVFQSYCSKNWNSVELNRNIMRVRSELDIESDKVPAK